MTLGTPKWIADSWEVARQQRHDEEVVRFTLRVAASEIRRKALERDRPDDPVNEEWIEGMYDAARFIEPGEEE